MAPLVVVRLALIVDDDGVGGDHGVMWVPFPSTKEVENCVVLFTILASTRMP